MPRKPMPWFRFYVETFADRKIRRFTPAQRWAWAAMLAAARESPEPGALYVAEGCPMTVEELADYADVKRSDMRRALELGTSLGMATVDADGLIRVTNWEKRQPNSDDVTGRVRAHRERSKEQVRNVPRNGSETNASRASARGEETEEETDTEPRSIDGGEPSPNATAASRNGAPPFCARHPIGNPTDAPCGGCQRVRAWHEQQADREQAERRAAAEHAHARTVFGDLERSRRAATPMPADVREHLASLRPKESA